MAGASLFALIDDIATILEDVSVMSKIAVKKTAGVLGDDLALNAKQVTGIQPNRELPVVLKVGYGSMINKAILVPSALAISALAPVAVTPLLMIGGVYLCFEGVEKLAHQYLHHGETDEEEKEHTQRIAAIIDTTTDMVAFEKERIQGAVRTDFVLSAEIIVITLGSVAHAPLLQQLGVLVAISIIMTFGVYGFVAGIVKIDDVGLYLIRQEGESLGPRWKRKIGSALLFFAPWLMKFLSVAGTLAMFLVGGGIILHGLPFAHHWVHEKLEHLHEISMIGHPLALIVGGTVDGLTGVAFGGLALLIVEPIKRLFKKPNPH